jgi:hypothetical protein
MCDPYPEADQRSFGEQNQEKLEECKRGECGGCLNCWGPPIVVYSQKEYEELEAKLESALNVIVAWDALIRELRKEHDYAESRAEGLEAERDIWERRAKSAEAEVERLRGLIVRHVMDSTAKNADEKNTDKMSKPDTEIRINLLEEENKQLKDRYEKLKEEKAYLSVREIDIIMAWADAATLNTTGEIDKTEGELWDKLIAWSEKLMEE